MITKKEIIEQLRYENISLELSIEQVWGSDGGLSFKEVALRMPHQVVYLSALKLDSDCLCVLRYDDVLNYRVANAPFKKSWAISSKGLPFFGLNLE